MMEEAPCKGLLPAVPEPAQQGRLGRPWPPSFWPNKMAACQSLHTHTTECIVPVLPEYNFCRCRSMTMTNVRIRAEVYYRYILLHSMVKSTYIRCVDRGIPRLS